MQSGLALNVILVVIGLLPIELFIVWLHGHGHHSDGCHMIIINLCGTCSICKQCASRSRPYSIVIIFTNSPTDSNGSKCFIHEQVAEPFYLRALCDTCQ